mgnify:CR=1 FL=1
MLGGFPVVNDVTCYKINKSEMVPKETIDPIDWRERKLYVPLLDLKEQFLTIKEEVMAALEQVLETCEFILGPNVSAFEQEIAEYLGVKHAIGVGNGTDALVLIFDALGIGPGDEVITSPYTFFATAECVSRLGAKPVFVDINPITLTIDPEKLEQAITTRTKAVIPVHIFGRAVDMPRIMDIASRHDLFVVEDACQSIGGEIEGKKLGTFGNAGAFSFFPTKNLGAYGDGGLVVTDDDELAERVRMLRAHGSKVKYHNELIGYNSRLDEMQAAVLRVKLRHLNEWDSRRREIALEYNKLLKDLPLQLPDPGDKGEHVFHLYTILTDNREELRAYLKSRGVETGVYYPTPLHLQPAYADLGYRRGDFPVSESACERNLSLPMYPDLTDEQIHYVAETLRGFFEERSA